MSVIKFGNAVRELLLADAAVAAALPGGLWYLAVPTTVEHNLAAATYYSPDSDLPSSCAGALNHREVVLAVEFVGVDPAGAEAAHKAVEDRIITHMFQCITVGSTKVSQLEIGHLATSKERLPDGSGDNLVHFTTTISGALILS